MPGKVTGTSRGPASARVRVVRVGGVSEQFVACFGAGGGVCGG